MAGKQKKSPAESLGGVVEALREVLGASNPGVITREDIARLEERMDGLEQLVDELEDKLEDKIANKQARAD